MTIFVAAVY